jgi:hypothetical protein
MTELRLSCKQVMLQMLSHSLATLRYEQVTVVQRYRVVASQLLLATLLVAMATSSSTQVT